MSKGDERLCVGIVLGSHGLRGALRVRCFAESGLMAFGPLQNEAGENLAIEVIGHAKNYSTVKMAGVESCESAESLKGLKFFVSKDALPALDEDEFYYRDLEGLEAFAVTGERLGRVKTLHDFGAGDLIEIEDQGRFILYPFTQKVVPKIDLEAGQIVIDPPVEIEGLPELVGEEKNEES
jgi:16S rRNA processing protein RimM